MIHRFWGRATNTRLRPKKSYPLFSIGFTPRARQKKVIICFWLVLRFGLVKPILWSTDSGGVVPILGRGPKQVILCFRLVFHLGLGKKSYPLFLIGFTIRARKTNPVSHQFWGRVCNTRLDTLWGTHTGKLFREKSYPLFLIGFTIRARQQIYPLFLIGFTIRARKTNPVVNRFWGRCTNTR